MTGVFFCMAEIVVALSYFDPNTEKWHLLVCFLLEAYLLASSVDGQKALVIPVSLAQLKWTQIVQMKIITVVSYF